MFKNWSAGRLLLVGLALSVPLRAALSLVTFLSFGPLLGPIDLLLASGLGGGPWIWWADLAVSGALAVATAVAGDGLRQDRLWAYRLGLALARLYVAVNVVTALVTAALAFRFGPLVAPLALYAASAGLGFLAARRLAAEGGSPLVLGLAALRRLQPR